MIFRETIDTINYHLKVCDYTLHKPTLINTQIEHTVINYSPCTRYLLSVDIRKPAKYEDVKEYLINYKTDSY